MLATAYSFLEYLYSRITKFNNKGADNRCQPLIKRNLVFGMEFKFTSGIYIFTQPISEILFYRGCAGLKIFINPYMFVLLISHMILLYLLQTHESNRLQRQFLLLLPWKDYKFCYLHSENRFRFRQSEE